MCQRLLVSFPVSVWYSSEVELLTASQGDVLVTAEMLKVFRPTHCPCVLLCHQLTAMKSIEVGHISIT